MSKHTPGPWEVEQDGPWTLVRGRDPELPSDDIPGPLVCTPADNGYTQANAHLIAAAPDLLAALKEIVAGISVGTDPDHPWIKEARAAIAKAEGRSS